MAIKTRHLVPGQLVIIRHQGRELVKRVQAVDNDKLYIVGDNSTASTDSRDFGWVERQAVLARVIWPR